MKKSVVISMAVVVAGLFSSASIAEAQVVVKVKPARPTYVLVAPVKAKPHKVWVDGHWKWNKTTHSYQWVRGHYVNHRKGYRYHQGHWVMVGRRGYKWVPGKWQRV